MKKIEYTIINHEKRKNRINYAKWKIKKKIIGSINNNILLLKKVNKKEKQINKY